MPHKLVDLECQSCGHKWEDLVMPGESREDLHGCPECGSTKVVLLPGGVATKLHDPAVRDEALKKRSIDHSNKHAKENLEKLQHKGVLRMK
jgi:predicted  nucleic acid-binding Zn-ribbon protein